MSDDIYTMTIWGGPVGWSPAEAAAEYPRLWREIEALFPSLPEGGRLAVVMLMLNTCGSCHNAPSGCHCCNDD